MHKLCAHVDLPEPGWRSVPDRMSGWRHCATRDAGGADESGRLMSFVSSRPPPTSSGATTLRKCVCYLPPCRALMLGGTFKHSLFRIL